MIAVNCGDFKYIIVNILHFIRRYYSEIWTFIYLTDEQIFVIYVQIYLTDEQIFIFLVQIYMTDEQISVFFVQIYLTDEQVFVFFVQILALFIAAGNGEGSLQDFLLSLNVLKPSRRTKVCVVCVIRGGLWTRGSVGQ